MFRLYARDLYGERINSNNITAIIIIKSVTNTIYDNNRAIVVSNRRVHRLMRDDAVIIMMIDDNNDDDGISTLYRESNKHGESAKQNNATHAKILKVRNQRNERCDVWSSMKVCVCIDEDVLL